MALLRRSLVALFALALALGMSGMAPGSNAQTMMSMEPGQMMPDCPGCNPDGSMGPSCLASCATPTAVLPVATIVPVVFTKLWRAPAASFRLADAVSGPEPPPPKRALLA
jgi:hypothetical protein